MSTARLLLKIYINRNSLANWLIGSLLFLIGVANLILVHAVPATGFLLFSLLYFPPTDEVLRRRLNMKIPAWIKITLAFILIWFTLGVSDLGDIIDDLHRQDPPKR